jgi:hypothetical protein
LCCVAAALMPPDLIKEAVSKAEEMIVSNKVDDSCIKTTAKILRSVIKDLASQLGIELKLRKGLKNGGKRR